MGRNLRQAYWNRELAKIRARHPRFFVAVVADARIAAASRGERAEFRGRIDATRQILRLMLVSDSFVGLVCYRAQAALDARNIPLLPLLAHRLAMMTAQVCIGRSVVVQPGVLLGHGQVVIDGFVEIHRGAVIQPWVTIGLRGGRYPGPTVGRDVLIGTGAKVLGSVTISRGARVGANAVVLHDVPAGATVVGSPARVVAGVATPT